MGTGCTVCHIKSVLPDSKCEIDTSFYRAQSSHTLRDPNKKKHKSPVVNEIKQKDFIREAATALVTNKHKTPEDIENILKTLKGHFIFQNLDNDSQMAIIDHVKHYALGPKEVIFKQGDPGMSFFCVAKGRLEILCDGERSVIGPGTGFGELALLDDRPRTATIRTIEACSLWGVDRKTFNASLKRLNELNYAENKSFINSMAIFLPLNSNQREMMVSSLVTQKWICGQTIIKEGELGDLLYIIKEGFVICYENKQEKRHLVKGQYFGEQALLYDTPRTATVIAGSDVKVLSIAREALMIILGERYEYILYHNTQLIAIDKSSVLKSLSSSQVSILLKCMRFVKYKAGEVVIKRGSQKCEKLVMVLKGSIRGPINEMVVYSCIGDKEVANKDRSVYMVDYVAMADSDVGEVEVSELEKELGGEISQIAISNEANCIIEKVHLFRDLSIEKVKSLAMSLRLHHYDDGDTIVQQESPGEVFFIIKSGVVRVYKNGVYIRDVTKNDYFGERALLYNGFRTAAVVATGPVDCWVLSKGVFDEILDEKAKKTLQKRIEQQDLSISLDDLVPIKILGTGMFGNVILTRHKTSKILYAIKTISRNKIQSLDIYDNLVLERRIMLQLDHSMTIKLIKTCKDWNRIYFIMDFVNGQDLFDVLITLQTVREESAKFYAACLVVIIEYLHDRNIVHRDLKPENIMIDEDGYPKLIDFGTAKIFSGRTYTTLGTPHYMAPEIIIRNGYNSSVDLWSLGIMIYEIIFGKVPFGSEEEDTKIIYEKILENKLDLRQSPYNGTNYKSFIKQLLSTNPAARTGGSIEKLRLHPWFMNFNWKRLSQRKLKPPYIPKVVDYNTVLAFEKTIQEHIGDIEFSEAVGTRRVSLVEPDDWDSEF